MHAFSRLDDVRLRNELPQPHSMEQIDQILEDEIGKKALRAFSEFNPIPSRFSETGQIHHAILHDGRHVSVRIQNSILRQHIARDLDTLSEIASFIDHPSGRGAEHRFSRFVDRIRVSMMRELDYRREEAALLELREKMNHYTRLRVPMPVQEYCSTRVLTLELIDGSEIWEIRSSRAAHDTRELAEQFMSAYLDQILSHGVIHPHPNLENLLITPAGELVLSEACGVLRLCSATRSFLGFLLHAICEQDPEACAEALLRLGHPASATVSSSLSQRILEALSAETCGEQLRQMAMAASLEGRPFPIEVSRIADLLDQLAVGVAAISPQFDMHHYIIAHLRKRMDAIREHTVKFASTSAA